MKSEEMLKAIGKIDDELIEAYEKKSDNAEVKLSSGRGRTFKKAAAVIGSLAAVCLVAVIGVSALFSGGMKAAQSADMAAEANSWQEMGLKNSAKADEAYVDFDAPADMVEYAADSNSYTKEKSTYSASESSGSGYGYNPANVKLVYSAYVYLQAMDYDKALADLKQMVAELGGYFESSEEYNGGYNVEYYTKNGRYTVRIPAENYSKLIASVGENMYVANLSENVRDIGESYFETEKRLETLRIKQERLQDLLKEAKDLTDIITLENELSNTEYEIDMYTTTLNRYDSLVGYSTVTINLEEVKQYDGNAVVKDNFGTILLRRLRNGLVNALDNVEDFILWVGYNLIGIIIVVVIVLIVWKKHLIRRLFNRIFRKQD